MFFTLGLLVFPAALGDVALEGTILAVLAAVVARPAAVYLATAFSGFRRSERVVLGWAGLRGAVPVVLATFPVLAGVSDATRFFNIVFFAVLVSTLLQGSTFEALARRLGATTNEQAVPTPLAEGGTMRSLGAEIVEFGVGRGDAVVGARVRELGLPRDALLNVIVRGEQAIPPRGSTRVEAGDRLHVLVRQEVAIEFRRLLERWRTGPVVTQRTEHRLPRSTPSIFTSRPWLPDDGNPAAPERVSGLRVIQRLRTRRDVPGVLVELEDGRFATTGPRLMIGRQQRAARRRAAAPGRGRLRRRGRVVARGHRRAVGRARLSRPRLRPSARLLGSHVGGAEPAVDQERRRGHERRLVGGQEHGAARRSPRPSAKRPIGTWTSRRAAFSGSLAKSSRSSGVSTGPGHSALTRTPRRANSTPSSRDSASTPPLEAV